MEGYSLTADDAIKKTSDELNRAMVALDRWLAQTPGGPTSDFETFRLMKQNIKLLRLKRNELIDMKNDYQNTLTFQSLPPRENVSPPEIFSKPRGITTPLDERVGNKLGRRGANKVSYGSNK